jgi:DNA-binding transcriptional MerR regulator
MLSADVQSDLIRISELAQSCGVTVRTLEVYQRRGLIASALRLPNSYRYFEASLEEPIRAFGALLSVGASLRDVAGVWAACIPLQRAPTPEQIRDTMVRVRAFYGRRIAEIETDIARLRETQQFLSSRIGYCDEELGSGRPVKLGRATARVRSAKPGRIDYLLPADASTRR